MIYSFKILVFLLILTYLYIDINRYYERIYKKIS